MDPYKIFPHLKSIMLSAPIDTLSIVPPNKFATQSLHYKWQYHFNTQYIIEYIEFSSNELKCYLCETSLHLGLNIFKH